MNPEVSSLLDGKYWHRSDCEHKDTRSIRAKQEPFESPTKIKHSPTKKRQVANPKSEEEKQLLREKRLAAREALQSNLNARHSLKERQLQLESHGFVIYDGLILGVRKTEMDLPAKRLEVLTVLNVGDDTSNHFECEYEYHHIKVKEIEPIGVEIFLDVLNILRGCYTTNKSVLIFDRNGTRALAFSIAIVMAVKSVSFEQAMDHIHEIIGNDLIELRSNFIPSLESWEKALDELQEKEAPLINDNQNRVEEFDMAVEDQPLPVEDDVAYVDLGEVREENNTNVLNNNIKEEGSTKKKRKRSSNEEEGDSQSSPSKKQKVSLIPAKRELNFSTASIQISKEENFDTNNVPSIQISDEEPHEIKTEVVDVAFTKSIQISDEEIDNQSISSSNTATMFGKLKFPGLQQYAKAFEENGYDDLDHLIEIVDDEEQFNEMLNICGVVKKGHQSQLKKALQALKKV